MRYLAIVALIVGVLPSSRAQTLVDRTVSKVNGQIIMQSDVRRARQLKLVAPASPTDDATLVELENRLLVLAEIARASPAEPTADEIRARRQRWERTVGGAPAVPALLAEAHMTEAGLTAWMRDDVRIQKFLDLRFSRQADPAAEQQRWVNDLRRRAGLKPMGGGLADGQTVSDFA
jgi:hypothetical protein